MDLQKQQLCDKNKIGFWGAVAISACLLVLTALSAMNGLSGAAKFRLLICILVIVFNIVTYNKMKASEKYEHCACLSLTVLFIVALFTATNPVMYAVVYPIAIFVMAFAKKRLVQLGSASAMIFLTIAHAIMVSKGVLSISDMICEVVFTGLACVLASRITGMLIHHSQQNIDAIKDGADAQLEISNTMAELAKDLYHKFEDAQEVSDALNSKMETSNESVGEIANSTKSTAESIEEQTHQTSDIQNSIVTVGQEAKAMGEISDRTSDSVLEGVELINQLKVQAQQVTEINMETKKTTEMLNISINDVQNITETIMSISSQTNLLALNASIEAARAGEAGKGFAVVADEIRTLSEGTRAATEKITAIIGKLIQDADSASNSMMKSAEFAQKQHELITTTGEKLADIKANTDELRVGLQNVNDSVESVINANTLMMDSITNLSALSEEVAASSDTVLAQSNESLDALRDMNGLLSEIKDISQKMEETCSK